MKYARERKPFGKALAENQAIQWPLVELATQAEMLRLLIRKTAWEMDQLTQAQVEHTLSDKVSMCNFWANRLCCEAADRAMQVHGGMGYSRHKPFEHIYRHHRRYRITEGSEEIQKRKVAGILVRLYGGGEALRREAPSFRGRMRSIEPGNTSRNSGSGARRTILGNDGGVTPGAHPSIHLPLLARPIGIAQMTAQDLARRVARQRFDEIDRSSAS